MSSIEFVLYPTLLFSVTANSPAFECCACSTCDTEGRPLETPLYASVYVCERCGHYSCEQCHRGNLCLGCSYE